MEMYWIFYSGEPWLFPDGNFSLGPRIRFLANACMIGSWPFVILFTASEIENHAARSTSGTSTVRPDVLLNSTGSKSRSIAQAEISFPLGCLNVPNSKNSPATTMPVSSLRAIRLPHVRSPRSRQSGLRASSNRRNGDPTNGPQ
jgi:hypothetical protein